MITVINEIYYPQLSIWRDPDEIKSEIDSIKASLREANKRMTALEAAKDGIAALLDTQDIGDDTSVVQMLEVLLEKAEETYNECSLLSENIDSLKEELDESIWWAKGGITKDTRKA